MKAIRLQEPRRLERIELNEPDAPGPGRALVRVHRVGICGTDIAGYLGKMPFFRYPRVPGHELGVEVLAVGEGVGNVAVGDRCSVEPYLNCGVCFACRRGRGNCCENLEVLGVMTDGGMRERFVVRAEKLHRSTKLAMEQLALVETLSIGCHAVDRAGLRAETATSVATSGGEDVLVIGAGPIGLAAMEFVKLTGARLLVLDLNERRLAFCGTAMGADEVVVGGETEATEKKLRELTDGRLPSVVIDATGSARSMSEAFGYVGHTGKLVFVGITMEDVSFPDPLLHRREMTVYASRNSLPGDFERIIALIEEGRIDTGPWITHRTSFEELVGVFPSYTRPETGVIKAVVEVD